VKFVGLTGGIGSGKSTVGAALARRGALVIDVDVVSRELQEPGQPFFEQIVARWGPAVVGPDGGLDRAGLAAIVFHDREQLAELTTMAAPLVEAELVRRAAARLDTDDVVVCESAMYLRPMYGMEGLIVVDVASEVAVERLVTQRGMAEADARARIASQLTRELRLEHAGFIIDNSGGESELENHIQAAWCWILQLPDATPVLERRSAQH